MTTVEGSTTALVTEAAPDNKTRRYDRQLRLWAASGQSALESSRILLITGSATGTSILKNLVLPGIGSFTILDPLTVTPEDAGNNFFLDGPRSVGKGRAEEAVRLLVEMNEGVRGVAVQKGVEDVLNGGEGKEWVREFSVVIAVNLEKEVLDRLAGVLWEGDNGEEEESYPPLVVVRSAGFLAEFFIQYREHTVIESHPETAQSLHIDRPFKELLDYAMSLDFEGMDVTDHGHVPYVIILVRVLEEWKREHGGNPPQTSADKSLFKKRIYSMRKKPDEENFEEAEAQAWRCWTKTTVPSEIKALFEDEKIISASSAASQAQGKQEDKPFYKLVRALKKFTDEHGALPVTSGLPDMKASTGAYVELQKMYRRRAEIERGLFIAYLGAEEGNGREGVTEEMVDAFVKNAHALKMLRGRKWSALDGDSEGLAQAIESSPKQLAIHLALSAYASWAAKNKDKANSSTEELTVDALTKEVKALIPDGKELPDEFEEYVGEVVRSPTSELPNTAAFLGGVVAQEVIKMITKQYVPICGYCVVDLVETWTGIL